MKSENNFFTVIIITLMVLTVYPLIAKHLFPQYFAPSAPATAVVRSENPAMAPTGSINPTYSFEKSYVLENEKIRVIVNAPGADISRIELLKYIDPTTQRPTVLIDTENNMPGVLSDTGLTDRAVLQDVAAGDNALVFTYRKDPGILITKRLILDMNTSGLQLEVDIKSEVDFIAEYRLTAVAGLPPVTGMDARFEEALVMFEDSKLRKRGVSGIQKMEVISGNVRLAGAKNRYFSLALIPVDSDGGIYGYWDKQQSTASSQTALVGLGVSGAQVVANKDFTKKFVLYAGPSNYDEMATLQLKAEDIRGKGFFVGFSDFLMLLLHTLYKLFRNYGLAVVALSLLINLFLYPLTLKSMRSMKEMQALQPHMDKLRTTHKDDPQKLNKEIMELYKKHKVNPAGGCFPLIFQMPVFISLYNVLIHAVELRGARFLWIKDLSAPDAFITFPGSFPFIGNGLNLLPLVMIAISFLQQRLTTTGQMNEQQKAMAMMMPVVLGVVFYNFPSGLALYFLTNSIFSFFVQFNLMRQPGAAAA